MHASNDPTAAPNCTPAMAFLWGLLPPLGWFYLGRTWLAWGSGFALILLVLAAFFWPAPGLVLPVLVLASAFACALQARGRRQGAGAPALFGGLVALLVIGWVGLRLFVFDFFHSLSLSMEPTVKVGSIVLVDIRHSTRRQIARIWPGSLPPAEPPGPGELWLFARENDAPWLKRVIGAPGDHIHISDAGVQVNGQPIRTQILGAGRQEETLGEHRYQVHSRFLAGSEPPLERALGEGEFWVMGDNRRNSMDSRHIGPVGAGDMLGRVVGAWSF